MDIQAAARASMQLEQTLQDKYAQLRKEALQKTIFPKKKLNRDWLIAAVQGMQFVSILAAGVGPDVYKSVVFLANDYEQPLTLEQVACLCNSFESLSPDQLKMPYTKYCAYQTINKSISEEWNNIVNTITNDLQTQYKEELMIKKTAQNTAPLLKSVPQA